MIWPGRAEITHRSAQFGPCLTSFGAYAEKATNREAPEQTEGVDDQVHPGGSSPA